MGRPDSTGCCNAMSNLEKLFNKISDIFGAVSMLCMGFLMIGTTIDVTVRAVYGRSISGVFEMAETSMVLLVFLGLGWAQRDGSHIRVTMLTQKWSDSTRRFTETIAWSMAALLLLLLAIPSSEDAIKSFLIKEFRWGFVEFPIWWAKIILAIALWFGFLQMLLFSIRIAICGVPNINEDKPLDDILSRNQVQD